MNMEGIDAGGRSASRPRPFRPRGTSRVTALLLALGLACIALFALSALAPSYIWEWLESLFEAPARALTPRYLPWAGVALIASSALWEGVSRLRVPPPTWRVRQELSKALIDMGLLPRDTARWKGVYWTAPLASYSFKGKRLSLLFNVKHARATEERFGKAEDAILSSFSHSQGVSIEPASICGRRECWRLVVRYAPSAREEVESPW